MSNRKKPKNPLRDALNSKTSLRTYYELPVADQEQVEEAKRKLDVVNQLAAGTLLNKDPEVQEQVAEAVAEARTERDACFHRIYFRGLGLTEFDALVKLHPPTKEQAADHWQWNSDTFDCALLEHATVDSDLTAEDWEAHLSDEEKWPAPDRARLIQACLQAQRQTMADAAPKG